VTDVDETLLDSDESGVKLIAGEKAEMDNSARAMVLQQHASGMEGLAGLMHFIPTGTVDAKPFGLGAGASFGGSNIGGGISGFAKIPQILSSVKTHEASQAAKKASYIRREQDWTLQANLAAREVVQLDKQITSADIRVQVTQKELENHKQQIENAGATETFLKNKFTNQELYQWMKEQLFAVYKQSYNLAYDMAKKAEKAYKYEMGTELASFIQYGYWDNSMQGLAAGEKLQLALRRLEKSYLEENRREFELTRHVSLRQLDPLALLGLRAKGTCLVTVPEWLYDLDCPGHYMRRIKNVALSIPSVVGPYTSLNCTLSLQGSQLRRSPIAKDNLYERQGLEDERFVSYAGGMQSIVTSSGNNDSGLFETNLRDERFLPFEGAGAESTWQLDLPPKDSATFDYATIADVILHIRYTARQGVQPGSVAVALDKLFAEAGAANLGLLLNLRHDFSTEWAAFANASASAPFSAKIRRDYFPYFTQGKKITLTGLDLYGADPLRSESIHRSIPNSQVDLVATTANLNNPARESTLTIPPDMTVLTPSAHQVFLVIRYTLS
jgi:hypothetical protein